eukprot:7867332-Pyramimonas_sp.AAC.1
MYAAKIKGERGHPWRMPDRMSNPGIENLQPPPCTPHHCREIRVRKAPRQERRSRASTPSGN